MSLNVKKTTSLTTIFYFLHRNKYICIQMSLQNKHIAWLFILVFAIFGVEKINFSTEPICSKTLKFCPTANMYIYNVYHISTDHSNKEKNSSKVTTISCETFFLNQTQIVLDTKKRLTHNYSTFFYKPVIHSTPYIPLTDPPPIA